MVLPVGTTLIFDHFCENATALTTDDTQYQQTRLAAGPLIFDVEGHVGLARLSGENKVHELPLDANQPVTLLFENGNPRSIRLGASGVQNGITFEPMGELEDRFARTPELTTMPSKYLYQLTIATDNSYDPGTTRLHSNGQVALGRVMKPAVVQGFPIAAGITYFAENGRVIKGKLSDPYEYDGWKLTTGEFSISEKGKLHKAVLAENAVLNQ